MNMKVAIYSIHKFEQPYLLEANDGKHELVLIDARLSETTTSLADGCETISIFTGDKATAPVLETLHKTGVKYLALRSAGFNPMWIWQRQKNSI